MRRASSRVRSYLTTILVVAAGVASCARDRPPSAMDTLSANAVAANAREQRPPPSTVPVHAGVPRRGEPARRTTTGEGPLDGYGTSVGFRSRDRLTEHFAKHGGEFGDIDISEYLRRAQTLRDARAGGDILEVVRDDGVVSRFDRNSGAFLAFDRDGTIRTFFRPNDGENYFRRQSRRRPMP